MTCPTLGSSAPTLVIALLSIATPLASAQPCGNPMVAQPLLDLLPPGDETIAAVASGAWSSPATWGGATVADLPMPGDRVLIPAGITVTYDIDDDGDGAGPDSTRFRVVRVDGTLAWATDRDTTLYVDTLFNSPGGTITVGTDDEPIPAGFSADVVIVSDDPMDFGRDPRQLGRGFIPHGPNRVVGADKTDVAALVGDALAGENRLTLREAPVGWEVGDTLVLGGTSYDPSGSDADNSRFRDEVLTVTAVDARAVTFTNAAPGFEGLRWDHARPDGAHFNPDDLTLYVANLSRNVTFRSELDPLSPDAPGPGDRQDLRRGHVMVMHTPDSIIRNAAFVGFGRLNKNHFIDAPGTNVDGTVGAGTNQRGRYAVHHHRNLPRNNAPVDFQSCPPAEITGCVVHGSPGWGFVHHDSYSLLEDNVAFDVLGAAFVQESGNEIGTWRGNISIKTTGDDDPDLTVEPFGDGFKRVTNFDFGFNGEAYWVQGASQVRLIDNIAISAAGGGMDIFSDVDGNQNRDVDAIPREHLHPDVQHIVTTDSGLITLNRVPSRTVSGFTVYNSDFGLLTWNHMRNQGAWTGFVCPCDGNLHREYATIEGFKFWNIYGQGVHLQYTSQVNFVDGIVASSDLATPGVDDKPAVDLAINGDGRGFGFGMNGPTKRLRLENVVVEGWELGLRTPIEGQINALDDGTGVGSDGAMGLPLRRSEFVDLKLANNTNNFYRNQNGFSPTQSPPNFLLIEGGEFDVPADNLPPVASFAQGSLGTLGVVRFDGAASTDPDASIGPAFSPSVAFVGDTNAIVAYAWDFDGDGAHDAFGEVVTARLPGDGPTPVTLTVWDHQGATGAVTLDVTPHAGSYGELIVDGSFDAGEFRGGIYGLESSGASTGWYGARANIDAQGRAVLTGEFNFSSVAQAIYDDFARRGPQTFSFDLEINQAPGTPTSVVTVTVHGVNGEFTSNHREATPAQLSAVPVEITPIYTETFVAPLELQTIERDIDFGAAGFRYIHVGFAGEGVRDSVAGDFARLDNVSIASELCAADTDADAHIGPSDLFTVLAHFGSNTLGGPAAGDVAPEGAPNGVVDAVDLFMVLGSFGLTCG